MLKILLFCNPKRLDEKNPQEIAEDYPESGNTFSATVSTLNRFRKLFPVQIDVDNDTCNAYLNAKEELVLDRSLVELLLFTIENLKSLFNFFPNYRIEEIDKNYTFIHYTVSYR